jgi:hypothetical protein
MKNKLSCWRTGIQLLGLRSTQSQLLHISCIKVPSEYFLYSNGVDQVIPTVSAARYRTSRNGDRVTVPPVRSNHADGVARPA